MAKHTLVSVDGSETPLVSVNGDDAPSVPAGDVRPPVPPVDDGKTPLVSVDGSGTLPVSVDGSGTPPVSVDGDDAPPVSVDGNETVDVTTVFNLCDFPSSLKKAIEDQLQMNCIDITKDHLAQMKELRIKYIFEEELPLLNKDYAAYFTSLEKLNISKNLYISYLPAFVAHISSLKELNVSQTGISDFSENICNLKNLTTLIANRNNYKGKEVPINIFCLSSLKILDMSYSFIYYIDENIHKLVSLEELHMKGNELMAVPFMLHLLPHLLVVDFRNNMFDPLDIYVYTAGAYNILYDCKQYSDSKDREECQEEMRGDFECGWIVKVPFQRGQSFRQYKALEDMTEAERESFERTKPQPSKNRCYSFWLNNTFLSLSDEEKEIVREKTINGKTIREWRLVYSERNNYSIWRKFGASMCEQVLLYMDTIHLPDSQEVFPELYHSPDWTEPPKAECVGESEKADEE